MFVKRKDIVKLCRKINETYHVVKTIVLRRETQKIVKFRERSYNIVLENPTFIVKLNFFYYIDIDTNSMLYFDKVKGFDPEALDLIVSQRVVQNLTNSLKESGFPIEMKSMIIGGFIGACISLIICLFLSIYGVM